MGKERYTLVAHPLRTKVSTNGPMRLGRSPSMSLQKQSLASAHQPEDTLRAMKTLQQDRIREQNERNKKVKKQTAGSDRSSALPKI